MSEFEHERQQLAFQKMSERAREVVNGIYQTTLIQHAVIYRAHLFMDDLQPGRRLFPSGSTASNKQRPGRNRNWGQRVNYKDTTGQVLPS